MSWNGTASALESEEEEEEEGLLTGYNE